MFTYFPENDVYISSNPKIYFCKVNGLWNSGSYLPANITLTDVQESVMLSGNPSNSPEHKVVLTPQTETRILLVPQKTETKFKYIFYPDVRVYFDPIASEYLVNENGTWRIYKTVPPSVILNPSIGEQIYLNEDIRITTIP